MQPALSHWVRSLRPSPSFGSLSAPVGRILLMFLCHLPPVFSQAAPGQAYESLRLPFNARHDLFWRLVNTERADETNAVGDSLIRDASLAQDKVYLPAAMAIMYKGGDHWQKRRQYIAKSEEAASSWAFRAMPISGELGYWKSWALYWMEAAKCVASSAESRHEHSRAACALAVANAEAAQRLVRLTWVRPATGDLDIASAHMYKAYADMRAGRNHDADLSIEKAGRLISLHPNDWVREQHYLREGARVRLTQGRSDQAAEFARKAIGLLRGRGVPVNAYRLQESHALLQDALVQAGRWDDAQAEFDANDAGLAQAGSTRITNLQTRALVWGRAGRLKELAPLLESANNSLQAGLGPNSVDGLLIMGLWGASEATGAEPTALAHERLMQAAEGLLDAMSRGDPVLRVGINSIVLTFVLEQALESAERLRPSGSASDLEFRLGEALRSSRVDLAIHDSAVRSAISSPELADLVRRDQDARHEIGFLQTFVAQQVFADDKAQLKDVVRQVQARIAELNGVRATLGTQIALAYPEYEALTRPKIPNLDQVGRALLSGEALVSYLPVREGVHIWTIVRGRSSYRFVNVPSNRLTAAVEDVRASTDLQSGRLRPFAFGAARDLYGHLLAPLEAELAGVGHLVLATGGILGKLPFAALITAPDGAVSPEPAWLAHSFAVSQVPSASAWLAIRRQGLSARAPEPLLAWGDPTFSVQADAAANAPAATTRSLLKQLPSADIGSAPTRQAMAYRYSDFPALPETRDELRSIALTLNANLQTDLLVGAQATRESVIRASRRGELASRKVVVFATHGLMAGDLPNLSQPALALAATSEADSNPLQPLLLLDDVLSLKMNADWVVLSACNTAAADGKAEEALTGLARGFFYAGARSLLVTHWAVETESAKLLTTGTFAYYASNPTAGKAESLRQAMLKVMSVPQYRHPAYWAPYALVGDGGR